MLIMLETRLLEEAVPLAQVHMQFDCPSPLAKFQRVGAARETLVRCGLAHFPVIFQVL